MISTVYSPNNLSLGNAILSLIISTLEYENESKWLLRILPFLQISGRIHHAYELEGLILLKCSDYLNQHADSMQSLLKY